MTTRSNLARAWRDSFGETAQQAHAVANSLGDHPDLAKVLFEIIPDTSTYRLTDPRRLGTFLRLLENYPIDVDGHTYQFTREGYAWRLIQTQKLQAVA